MNFINLLIYLFTSKKVGKPTAYGRSLNVFNVHPRQLHGRITRLGCDDWLFCEELLVVLSGVSETKIYIIQRLGF
jgi:hypothetical protein